MKISIRKWLEECLKFWVSGHLGKHPIPFVAQSPQLPWLPWQRKRLKLAEAIYGSQSKINPKTGRLRAERHLNHTVPVAESTSLWHKNHQIGRWLSCFMQCILFSTICSNLDVSFELCRYWSLSGRAPLLIHSLSHRSREFLMLVFTLRLLQHRWCHDAHDVNLRFIHWARPHHSLHPLDGEVHHSHPARWQALLVFFLHFHVFELRFSCISASSSRARLIAPVTKKKQFQWCFKFKQTLFDEFICASWMNLSHLGWSATSTGPGPSSAATHWVELKWPYGGHVAFFWKPKDICRRIP